MITWILIVIISTPWFWSLPVPKNIVHTEIKREISETRSSVTWERGRINPSVTDKFFLNWPLELIHQRISVVMENIDIGNYFFAGHPRERVGVQERQKFFFFEFILLLVGFTNQNIKKYKKFLVISTVLCLLGVFLFEWRTFDQTIFLSIPLVFVMALGLQKIVLRNNKWRLMFVMFSLLEIISFLIFYLKGFLS